MPNAIAISRDLVAAGFSQEQANAVAEMVVTQINEAVAAEAEHINDTVATKADVARLDTGIKIALGLILGLYVAIGTLYLSGPPA